MNIGIYIYDNAEVLDFSGPFEVFSTASRLCKSDIPFNVFLVSETGNMVSARAGYSVLPSYGFQNHPEIDVLVVSGGGHTDEMKKHHVIDWISKQSRKASMVASVCTGVFLLAQAEILNEHKVTTHWEDVADLRKLFPRLKVVENVRWVDEGSIITSGGISAGIDMSLHLVSKLHSNDLAEKTARQMDFVWTKNA
ncbi:MULTISPECIES: DJ-1/PfpI family protein [unclassified Methylophaga]|jgi:transcriptional regulator GlxA family with amidase domain|uniref:DJ-1/PfpI family protein n=1 Tax=unclassified Methylophaga TaxID=2629249 RepID=UPI000C8A3EF6|nr:MULTISPECIES: DJ-1/PfpI family protein [unclassified Methylophaga]MAP27622.1 glutamine amidotransferase [Methylophaga sp.]HBX60954.1 glutamine amidotransferase [Methylophaga sp.]HCN99832.1 glutamine amidotransferase [Methylophaga sp.]|tara:strand:+ start:1294 stop:1878 length:585 start_codon:yes stop_codon:yes gene_type:complete